MESQDELLKDYSTGEKTAYLSAIAAIATADRTAGEEEVAFLDALAESAELPEEETARIRQSAMAAQTNGTLKADLDVLKTSDLRFSLMADLLAFAEADQNYSPEEKQHIEKVAQYLDIDQKQFATLNQFVDKASSANISEETAMQPDGLLRSLGMENQFQSAGLNFGSISKGLLGMLAPIILGRMFSRRGGTEGTGGGILGSVLGGLLGTGGFGSLISMLNKGKSSGNIGGMLGRMFR